MPTYKKKPNFVETDLGVEIEKALRSMVADTAFNTDSSYSANTVTYPDHQIPFVTKHMDFLRSHPSTDPRQYLANLRIMTRLK